MTPSWRIFFATGPRCIGRDAGQGGGSARSAAAQRQRRGNLDDGQESARPRRWRAEQVTVGELAGHERSELAVLRHALTAASLHRGKMQPSSPAR
ncbi:hypothetical protein MJ390_18610 [Klebsiella pneumoniae]|nr:hypothetical protein MJ390_18610 [Klebsiella pneumoniae]